MNALLADLAREREERSGPHSGPSTSSPAPSSATKRSHDIIDLCDSDDEGPARSRCNQETADRALAIRLAREQEESASLNLAAELAQQFGSGGGGDGLVVMGFDPDRLRLSFARGSGRVRGTLADRARVGTCGFAQVAFYPREVKDKGKHEHYAERFGAVELDGLYYQVPAKASFEAWRRLADSNAGRADAYEVVPKCNDFFTHKKRLIVDDAFRERWAGFMDKCAVLGDRCPALLMQVCPTSSAAAALQGGRGSARPPCTPCIGLSRSPAPLGARTGSPTARTRRRGSASCAPRRPTRGSSSSRS